MDTDTQFHTPEGCQNAVTEGQGQALQACPKGGEECTDKRECMQLQKTAGTTWGFAAK